MNIFGLNLNFHVSTESNYQHQWRINVWTGIVGGTVVGPVFLPASLNGANYLRFLSDALDDVPASVMVRESRDGTKDNFPA